MAFQNTVWRENSSEISNDNIEETLISDTSDEENEALLVGTRDKTFQKEDNVDDVDDVVDVVVLDKYNKINVTNTSSCIMHY